MKPLNEYETPITDMRKHHRGAMGPASKHRDLVVMAEIAGDFERKLALCRDALGSYAEAVVSGGTIAREALKATK